MARRVGLASEARWRRLQEKEAAIARACELLQSHRADGVPLAKYLRRPEVHWRDLVRRLPLLAEISPEAADQVVYDTKYAGYVARQQQQVDRQQRLANKRIPRSFDFRCISHLRTEAREKLARIRPDDLAQASRISGITPADLALILAHLEGRG